MNTIEISEESGAWRAREVCYYKGSWDNVRKLIPSFELQEFRDSVSGSVNPYYKTVVRKPLTKFEQPIPIGLVSNTYTLAEHSDIARRCIESIKSCGIAPSELSCEVGLSSLGEWMNFRVYFPKRHDFNAKDASPMRLRLECYNSVDGSSRLVILFGWFRLICANGLVIGETISEIKDIHNSKMDLDRVTSRITKSMSKIEADKLKMEDWQQTKIDYETFPLWIDEQVAEKWGKLAAFRVYHICKNGHDAEFQDPFETAPPTTKKPTLLTPVPGSPAQAQNLYDVAQALSWVATQRDNVEVKTQLQTEIPILIRSLTPPPFNLTA